jgi:hypothetical protein
MSAGYKTTIASGGAQRSKFLSVRTCFGSGAASACLGRRGFSLSCRLHRLRLGGIGDNDRQNAGRLIGTGRFRLEVHGARRFIEGLSTAQNALRFSRNLEADFALNDVTKDKAGMPGVRGLAVLERGTVPGRLRSASGTEQEAPLRRLSSPVVELSLGVPYLQTRPRRRQRRQRVSNSRLWSMSRV